MQTPQKTTTQKTFRLVSSKLFLIYITPRVGDESKGLSRY